MINQIYKVIANSNKMARNYIFCAKSVENEDWGTGIKTLIRFYNIKDFELDIKSNYYLSSLIGDLIENISSSEIDAGCFISELSTDVVTNKLLDLGFIKMKFDLGQTVRIKSLDFLERNYMKSSCQEMKEFRKKTKASIFDRRANDVGIIVAIDYNSKLLALKHQYSKANIDNEEIAPYWFDEICEDGEL